MCHPFQGTGVDGLWRVMGVRRDMMVIFLTAEAGGSTGLLMDLAANEKAVHADFFNEMFKTSVKRWFEGE
ncbi:hypothetical protein llap_13415 [Limosa lapponica baueri]|uniref:COP9 signalosome complex subunit 9 n=1 Tax=Limosa lapponica baueri TaxID=1758121 RepID=A0A2I0TR61_LIMLA|nr:hypothetical protein llap_13415 [Limosa lapponica baueri]